MKGFCIKCNEREIEIFSNSNFASTQGICEECLIKLVNKRAIEFGFCAFCRDNQVNIHYTHSQGNLMKRVGICELHVKEGLSFFRKTKLETEEIKEQLSLF